MKQEELVAYLKEVNPWWSGAFPESILGTFREEYVSKIRQAMKHRNIVAVLGLRRAGKTTLLFQLTKKLLGESGRVVFCRIEDIYEGLDSLKEIIDAYEFLSGIDLKNEDAVFLLDEIQYFEKWQIELKRFVDSGYKIRFVVSGSSKIQIYKDASESLVGRISFVEVAPLSFFEFASFSGISVKKPAFALDEKSLRHSYYELATKRNKLHSLLDEYLEVGGFPEWFKVKDRLRWKDIVLNEYLALTIFKDIVRLFKIKNPLLIQKLAKDAAANSAERFNYSGMAKRLDTDRETIRLYLTYLSSSRLCHVLDPYTRGGKLREKREKKLVFGETGMKNAIAGPDKPRDVETAVALHLIHYGHNEKVFFTPFYWRNGSEVDFVLETDELLVPIETKYQSGISESDLAGVRGFMAEFRCKQGVVVSRDSFDVKGGVFVLPAWFFLLMF
ncbi:ATP-binding protein [Candidatus Micrarchaeota archaeon]|nr:ATP-binding protein [Candidatus Micrarchaeota archaeon]